MSADKFKNIIKGLEMASSEDIVSLVNLQKRLAEDFGTVPSNQTLIKWMARDEQPKITDLTKILNPAGGILTGFYYYPQVKQAVMKYYNMNRGRKRSL
jgi:hypothetical protein